ncbi:MAG: porphobilinogen synthase [Symbiobacteriia bacterium]
MSFPAERPRRLRRTETIRGMVRETELAAKDFIYPMFICPGENVREEISSMPGQYRVSVDEMLRDLEELSTLGVPSAMFFGLPESKDSLATGAYAADGIVARALRAAKKAFPHLYLVPDVCLCEYTDHGHCGIIHDGEVQNDETLKLLAQTALAYAEAGADMIAPSDMMDGRIAAIRQALDRAGYSMTPIMAYSAKYASAFYGPFREAADSAPQFGDRRGYQMDPANSREALREVRLDLEEGADVVMVKPALSYLDVIRQVKDEVDVPVAAYNVSGEYAMVKAAARNGWIDERRVAMEILTSIKRAGADMILTYFAKDAARWLKEQG